MTKLKLVHPVPEKKSENKIYQLKIILKGIKPPIWRRVQVESNMTLGELHHLIQDVMGWYNCHLHQFDCEGVLYADLSTEEDLECFDKAKDENKTALNKVLRQEKQKMRYDYDFGDSWEHEIVLEKILKPEEGMPYPVCLDGKRSCPPEDCGGEYGYQNLLDILKDPKHPEYKEWKEWLPEGFDSEAFDVKERNDIIRNKNERLEMLH